MDARPLGADSSLFSSRPGPQGDMFVGLAWGAHAIFHSAFLAARFLNGFPCCDVIFSIFPLLGGALFFLDSSPQADKARVAGPMSTHYKNIPFRPVCRELRVSTPEWTKADLMPVTGLSVPHGASFVGPDEEMARAFGGCPN